MPAAAPQSIYYRAEKADRMIIAPLDIITLIYHRTSGITHMVADPVPQILAAMRGDILTAAALARRLADEYELSHRADKADAAAIISERLAELAQLGLVEAVPCGMNFA